MFSGFWSLLGLSLGLAGGFYFSGFSVFRNRKTSGSMAALQRFVKKVKRSDPQSEALLLNRVNQWPLPDDLTTEESVVLHQVKSVLELRGLLWGEWGTGTTWVAQNLVAGRILPIAATSAVPSDFHLDSVAETAHHVAALYFNVLEAAKTGPSWLKPFAKELLEESVGEAAEVNVDAFSIVLSHHEGFAVMILNALKSGRYEQAREIAQQTLIGRLSIDEDTRSALYWLSELSWFANEGSREILDNELMIRYLYHLCFVSPERAAFLEIDSRFFAQFETLNELAQEGFLFRESLMDRLLVLWAQFPGRWNEEFNGVLQALTSVRSKIHADLPSWQSFWRRSREEFGLESLYLVEGNLSYAAGHYDDAAHFYEKAVQQNPELRSARHNLLFALAKMGDWERHSECVAEYLKQSPLPADVLSVIGNSFEVAGRTSDADLYYERLKACEGWERKAEFYRSTFCYEHALWDRALEFAKTASELSPEDPSVTYHLSLCFRAVGNHEDALKALNRMPQAPHLRWLGFYRFTLERDAGNLLDAKNTLLEIPAEYYEDPEELEAAIQFARDQRDFVLLKHLKRK